jgi:glycosyltransferase involved in cell wall biosynthesis
VDAKARPGMKAKSCKVSLLKTQYQHWGKHTAFNGFLRYFDRNLFAVTLNNVPMGDGDFFSSSFSRIFLSRLKGNKLQEYRLHDLWAETRMFGRALFQRIDLIHFIDAEHSLRFLPGWFRKFAFVRSFPKIIAMYHQPPAILEKIIDVEIACLADHILTVAPEQTSYFARFMPLERISTILLGVDTEHFKPSYKKKDKGRFKCLGGGVWLRDYQAIFETAKLLAGIPEIEFHLVAPAFRVKANAGNVFFHEGISDSALLELYQNCHVLFLPLQAATANTFLLEGCACGLPIVSSDLPSLKVYFPGEEAILVKGNDPHVFAEVLTGLYQEPTLRLHMSECARQRALRLSWKNIVAEYEQMYLHLLEN